MNKEISIIEQRLQALMEEHEQFIKKMDTRIKNQEIKSSIAICNLSEISGDIEKAIPNTTLKNNCKKT